MRCNCDEDTRRSSTLTSYLKVGYTPRRLPGITTQSTQILRIRLLTRVETWSPLHATISRCVHWSFPTLHALEQTWVSTTRARARHRALALDSGACTASIITPLTRPVVWNIQTAGRLVEPLFEYRLCANALKPELAWIPSLRYRVCETVHNSLGIEIGAHARIGTHLCTYKRKPPPKKLYNASDDTANYTINYFPFISVEKTFGDTWY